MTTHGSAPTVKRAEVDVEAVRAFKSEHEYTGLSVEVLVEVGSYVCIAASIVPPSGRWTRHQAVLIGHFVRLFKLTSALVDQTCQHRRETAFILARLSFECIINAMFLIKNDRPEIVESYIHYSMRHEKRLRDTIHANVSARGGETWPIEKRMLASIEKAARDSGTDLESIDPPKNWAGKNLFEKAQDVGLEHVYLGAFAGPSHSVHGNWQELLDHNLEATDGGFLPHLDWHEPRPQLLTLVARLSVLMLQEFFREMVGPAGDDISARLSDLHERVDRLDQLHEQFLCAKTGATAI